MNRVCYFKKRTIHPRKLSLHLNLLLRFQLPIELRRIIIEDYFPFLPNEQEITFPEEYLSIVDEKFHMLLLLTGGKRTTVLKTLYDCGVALCLEMKVDVETPSMIVLQVTKRYNNVYADIFCRGFCINNKMLYLRDCQFNYIIYPNSELQVTVDEVLKNGAAIMKQRILNWYRNNLLHTIRES